MLKLLGITSLDLQAVALVAGGVWAVALLLILRKRDMAQADLAIKQAQLSDLELKARRFGLPVHIDAEVYWHEPDQSFLLVANVSIANHGSRDARLEWAGDTSQFVVRRCEFAPDDDTRYRTVATRYVAMTADPNVRGISHLVRAGGSEEFSFAVSLAEPGLYLLSFRAVTDQAERRDIGSKLPGAWTANRHIAIGHQRVGTA